MKNNLKRVLFLITLGILTSVTSSCARQSFPTQLYEIDYNNVHYDIDTKTITGEKSISSGNTEVFVLDKQGNPLYPTSKYKFAGKYNDKDYYYHFTDNNRVELLNQDGIICGEYANVPEGYQLPTPEILLSDRNIVLASKEPDYIFYDKMTGDILHELQADRCEDFENGIAVVENVSLTNNRTISDVELAMNGHSLNSYLSEDNFKFFITELSGTFSNVSSPQFAGQPFSADGLYEASYCQNGILPHLITVSKTISKAEDEDKNEQVKYTPYYIFKDKNNNIISQHMFSKTSGFKNGIAFCISPDNPNIMMMTLDGNYYPTELIVDTVSLNRVYYYPTFDCFGLTKSGKSTVPDVYVTRDGRIIADTPNKAKLFAQIIEYDLYIDYDTIINALNLVGNENEKYDSIIFDTGILISSPDECVIYAFNYETQFTEKYKTEAYDSEFYTSKIDDKFASTSCGVIDMTTAELVNETTHVIAYDEKNDTAYIDKITENADGSATDITLGYYKDKNTLIKFDCSECQYLGDGQFIIKQGKKYYTTVLF